MSIERITEDEVRALWVQRLSDTPNRAGRFGTGGMSAAEVKAVYDALPLRLVACYNALVDAILDGSLSEWLPAAEGMSLREILDAIPTGALASVLSVDGTRTLAALAAAMDTHDHKGQYAELSESGHLRADQLPEGSEDIFAEAEAAREAAEAERRAAEEGRGAALLAVTEAMEALEAREDERDMRESERDRAMEESTATVRALAEENARLVGRCEDLRRRLICLEEAGLGTTHLFLEDTAPALRKSVPEGALAYAALTRIGGAATVGKRATVTAVTSHARNLLAYPYPAAHTGSYTRNGVTFRHMGDGTILLDGTATDRIYYVLYSEQDGLALPEEGVYIHTEPTDGVTLYVKSGSSGSVWHTWSFTPKREDEFYGSYYVYLLISAGARFENCLVRPCISCGTAACEPTAYRAPYRVEIPPEVRALPGYGLHDNLIDTEAGVYRQRRTEGGAAMTAEVTYPLPEALCEPIWLPVEEGGYILFESAEGNAVENRITYVKKC